MKIKVTKSPRAKVLEEDEGQIVKLKNQLRGGAIGIAKNQSNQRNGDNLNESFRSILNLS